MTTDRGIAGAGGWLAARKNVGWALQPSVRLTTTAMGSCGCHSPTTATRCGWL